MQPTLANCLSDQVVSCESDDPLTIPDGSPQSAGQAPQRPHRGGMARLTPALRAVAAGAAALDVLAPGFSTEVMLRHFTRPRRKAGRDYRDQLPPGAQRLTLVHRHMSLTGWAWGFSGPAVLLVHGWEDHSGSMLGFVAPLLAMGFRVCVLDTPGHGLSPQAATHLVDTSFALENMAHSFGPFDSIVAHSFGAAAACLMLERTPALTPRRLALISPMRDIDQHLQIFADIALLSPERARRLRDRVERLIGCAADEVCALRAVQRLKVSGLVIHDRHDPVIPHAAGETLAKNLRGARFVSTSRLGHRRVLKCPSVLDAVLRHHGVDPDLF